MARNRVIAAVGLFALSAFVGVVVAREVLHPQLTPEKGTFDKAEGKIGEKPDQPWSVTTVAAAVDGKPVPG